MSIINTGRLKMGYQMQGSGPFLILLAGLGYGRWLWENQVGPLSEKFAVLTVDNRGIGESETPPPPYTVREMAEDIKSLLDSLDIKKAHVAGCSLGGFIAQQLALEHPQLVDKLILMSTTGGGKESKNASLKTITALKAAQLKKDPQEKTIAILKLTVGQEFFQDNYKMVEDIGQKFLQQKATSQGIQGQNNAGIQFWQKDNRWNDLDRIESETLIITGSEDKIVPPANSDTLVGKIPGAKKEVIEGAGHLVMWEKPADLNSILIDFLTS